MRLSGAVQGAFGELPQPASDQLAVVRACAYHLLNMLNMLRDVLKTLGSSDLEATLAKCQVDTPIEEVSMCCHREDGPPTPPAATGYASQAR